MYKAYNRHKKPDYNRPKAIKKIASFTVIPEYGWYLFSDGNIWYCGMDTICEGSPEYFLSVAHQRRLRWEDGYPELLEHRSKG